MPSQREFRRAAKRLLALEVRLKQARHVNRADFLRAHSMARAEAAEAAAAQTLVETLRLRFPHPAELAALREADFATVLDVATAGVTVLARVPGFDGSLARGVRAAAREARAELAAVAAPRFTPDEPTPAQTQLLRLIANRVVVDRWVGSRRDELLAFSRSAHRLLARAGDGGTDLEELVAPRLESDLAGGLASALKEARAGRPRGRGIWQDFQSHPSEYYAVIEALVGGPRRSARSYGAIPGELVAAAMAQRLDLSLFRSTLRPFQEFGVRFALFQGRLVLGDEAGLGRTAQTIALIAHLAATGERRALIIAPPNRHDHWERRIRHLSALTPVRVGGTRPTSSLSEWRAVGGVAIGTDEVLGKHGAFRTNGVALLVFDGSQHLVNADPAALRRIADVIDRTERVLLLTDATLDDQPAAILALARMARPDLASSIPAEPGGRKSATLRSLTSEVYLARTAGDVAAEVRHAAGAERGHLVQTDASGATAGR
jgi:hypothetical protein